VKNYRKITINRQSKPGHSTANPSLVSAIFLLFFTVTGRSMRQPPATAGITETFEPPGVGVCNPDAKRTSSSLT
jgi:hypothetical protein